MILFLVLSSCSFLFIGIGIYAMYRKEPMWFYSGSQDEIQEEIFHDVKEYNRKNGYMWILYGIVLMIPPLCKSLFSISSVVFLLSYMGIMVFGLIAMMLYWNYLHDQYIMKK
ncbi:hypothetical protein ACWG0P_12665 [Amedibacillus sp. YH-ame6]